MGEFRGYRYGLCEFFRSVSGLSNSSRLSFPFYRLYLCGRGLATNLYPYGSNSGAELYKDWFLIVVRFLPTGVIFRVQFVCYRDLPLFFRGARDGEAAGRVSLFLGSASSKFRHVVFGSPTRYAVHCLRRFLLSSRDIRYL